MQETSSRPRIHPRLCTLAQFTALATLVVDCNALVSFNAYLSKQLSAALTPSAGYPSLDTQTDGRTDGQTSCDSIVRAMHTRRAVTIKTSSSAVAKRPPDASCLSLASLQYVDRFRFNTAFTVLFCLRSSRACCRLR